MLFNSASFALFLPVVFFLYWLSDKKGLKLQNIILLAASCFFYACWDWRFLFLLLFSILLDYFTGIKIAESRAALTRKCWLWISITVNLGFLGLFKYYNFFAETFATVLTSAGLQVNPGTLDIVLPVGISFYTFHGLSYVIDIYKNRISAERNFVDYALFVSFFPLLVAGPIERATHLLPQIRTRRSFQYGQAVDGLRQILWGLFKKIVIADQCADFVNIIFNDHETLSGSTLALGAILFSLQIYGDFSGYSDIALGTARLFGIELLKNFSYPYFSRDIAEFWRRWHISLSSWFRDYVYIPLGGSKAGLWMKIRNTFIIFLLSGFWHGANWTFIAWGLLNALYIMPLIIFNRNRNNLEIVAASSALPSIKELLSILFTFMLTSFAWIFFRSADLASALSYVSEMCSGSLFEIPEIRPYPLLFAIMIFLAIEWNGRRENYAIAKIFERSAILRWSFYYIIILVLVLLSGPEQEFIYFQF